MQTALSHLKSAETAAPLLGGAGTNPLRVWRQSRRDSLEKQQEKSAVPLAEGKNCRKVKKIKWNTQVNCRALKEMVCIPFSTFSLPVVYGIG